MNANNEYIFFRSDGTVAGGGNGGEPSLWEGQWTFKNGAIGQLNVSITMEPSIGKTLSGTYKVHIFPDDAVLSLNCVDYIMSND